MVHPFSAVNPEKLIEQLFDRERRVLLFGQPGIGKTTLAAALAARLGRIGQRVYGLGADPGSPAFGVPGAINLSEWKQEDWQLIYSEAMCTLDAARFRLPLIAAVAKLAAEIKDANLLLDTPGVVRGVAGAELLDALVQAAEIDLVLVLVREGRDLHLAQELSSLNCEIAYVQASPKACRPGKVTRSKKRSQLWDDYLQEGVERWVSISSLKLLGTPPRKAEEAWLGKQVAFLANDRTRALGEVIGMDDDILHIRLPSVSSVTDTLLVRDACRDEDGLLVTGKRFAENVVRYIPPSDLVPDAMLADSDGPRPMVQLGNAMVSLLNGVFGDPLLHLRLRHQRRSLTFDLGDGSRLSARIAHQLTDVFITHAHLDHISGFVWLLRSRIGENGACRLYGPPGLAANIQGMINGILWDRIGDRGPRFRVFELHGNCLHHYALQAGLDSHERLDDLTIEEGVVLNDTGFQVRAVTLDHGTPVLAYAFEYCRQVNVRKERLLQRQLEPGPWLTQLKGAIHNGDDEKVIELPDGNSETVRELAADLTLTAPDSKLVYATDFADTPDNRERLMTLASGAHTLFCEATFLQKELEQARRTGHLTTKACAEIANAARVQHLIPFHFSRRYEEQLFQVYDEIAAICPRVVIPPKDDLK